MLSLVLDFGEGSENVLASMEYLHAGRYQQRNRSGGIGRQGLYAITNEQRKMKNERCRNWWEWLVFFRQHALLFSL